jgi:predicted SnoaL-like aldol condensation-catalyzing enzyme
MSLEKNKAIIRKTNEALNRKNLTALDEFMTLDYLDHTNQLRGREDVKQFYTRIFKDFPEWHRIIEDIVAEEDKVWVRFKSTGTAVSGKKLELTTVGIFRIVNGRIVEGWSIPRVTGDFYNKLL